MFDTGYSDAFIKNAYKMGINLIDLNYISFSHGHPDHTWGMTDLFRLFMEAKSGGRNFYLPISGN
ncbi:MULTISPECIES: MBL fold metallo-hydrolase [Bacillaceae]|uniref:MBL fold metallo-hydrolase n=1 Tax=Bacillaceae TaxID=186817 RepID=UPI0022862C09|nr:MBL fold metallo-hydrolase [Caldibacillus thermoamylovorans]